MLTTNVDHYFQKSGFDKSRLFYTQGDYGLWQCSKPCCQKTYDNEAAVKRMLKEQENMRVPGELVPYCPVCGAPMTMNLRADMTFVEDEGWHKALLRYKDFLRSYADRHILFLELGVGGNTPAIIKYPFWRLTYQNLRRFMPASIWEKPSALMALKNNLFVLIRILPMRCLLCNKLKGLSLIFITAF